MITCNICHQSKDDSEFYFRKNGKPRKECKTCKSVKNSKYYKENEQEIRQQTAEYKSFNSDKIKQDSIEYYQSNKITIRQLQKEYQISLRGRLINLMSYAKGRARQNKRGFNLDIDFLLEMFTAQNGQCKLTGISFSLEKENDCRVDPWAISIDRIDSKLGYTKDNVRLVCTVVNFALNEWGEKVLRTMSEAIIQHANNAARTI
jgi:hypothetical protein